MIHEVNFTYAKILKRLQIIEPLAYRAKWNLPDFRYKIYPENQTPVEISPDEMITLWDNIRPHEYWGGWNQDFVLFNRFKLTEEWKGWQNLALFLPLGEAGDFCHPEGLAYADGAPFAACDRQHQELSLPDLWRDGAEHDLLIKGWTGLGGWAGAEPGRLQMRQCQVVMVDLPTRDLIARTRVALGVVKNMSENDVARAYILNALDAAFKALDTREPLGEDFYTSVPMVIAALEEGLKQAGPAKPVKLFASGHAHIDVAWLWPVAQTRRKAARTFHTAIDLLEKYPEYHFTQSQPQLYEFIREDFPELFAKIQQKTAEGRWEVLGGMWLEADSNLTGAESLARQFLLGRNYFKKYFGEGAESPVCWLPDAFGFTWSLPQLIRQAGLKYFFTIKLSWSQYNKMPYDSFWWQGIDGSRVLAHFSPTPAVGSEWKANTYNAEVEPGQVMATWDQFKQKELHPNLLMAYGFGDGGGGPTRQMIENLKVLADFPGAPQVVSSSVGEFFRTVETEDGDRLPVWSDELYLEYHRGTLTSQSRNKRGNRKSEFALHDAEFLAATAALLNRDFIYPYAELDEDWKLVCLNQFHDILPGSSVGQVYQDSQKDYSRVMQSTRKITGQALEELAEYLPDQLEKITQGLLLANPTGFEREDPVFWKGGKPDGRQWKRADGSPVYLQSSRDGCWIAPGKLPPYGLVAIQTSEKKADPFPWEGVTAGKNMLENSLIRVEFNPAGDITRVYDKQNQREVIPAGQIANQFQAFEDRPNYWDAWDIEKSFDDRVWLSEPADKIEVVETGPLVGTIEITRRILHSTYTQRISLAFNSSRVEFDTVVHWDEKHILLKTAFPVEVFSPYATYEIQWGNIQRPTHSNTSWDWARFETCGHKWVDLSEGGYGVSLLNDCKYGHDIQGQVMRISLLRSSTDPDPHADEGLHHFHYVLYPHDGGWDEGTIAAAYGVNDPVLVQPLINQKMVQDYSLIRADQANVVIETVKLAEDGDGMIARLYESQRRRGKVTLQTGSLVQKAWLCDLLENRLHELPLVDGKVELFLTPYQIATLRLVFAASERG